LIEIGNDLDKGGSFFDPNDNPFFKLDQLPSFCVRYRN